MRLTEPSNPAEAEPDTPKTDAQIDQDEIEPIHIRYGRMIQHARGLERALNKLKAPQEHQSVVELAVNNPNLAEYLDYLEGQLATARQGIKALQNL